MPSRLTRNFQESEIRDLFSPDELRSQNLNISKGADRAYCVKTAEGREIPIRTIMESAQALLETEVTLAQASTMRLLCSKICTTLESQAGALAKLFTTRIASYNGLGLAKEIKQLIAELDLKISQAKQAEAERQKKQTEDRFKQWSLFKAYHPDAAKIDTDLANAYKRGQTLPDEVLAQATREAKDAAKQELSKKPEMIHSLMTPFREDAEMMGFASRIDKTILHNLNCTSSFYPELLVEVFSLDIHNSKPSLAELVSTILTNPEQASDFFAGLWNPLLASQEPVLRAVALHPAMLTQIGYYSVNDFLRQHPAYLNDRAVMEKAVAHEPACLKLVPIANPLFPDLLAQIFALNLGNPHPSLSQVVTAILENPKAASRFLAVYYPLVATQDSASRALALHPELLSQIGATITFFLQKHPDYLSDREIMKKAVALEPACLKLVPIANHLFPDLLAQIFALNLGNPHPSLSQVVTAILENPKAVSHFLAVYYPLVATQDSASRALALHPELISQIGETITSFLQKHPDYLSDRKVMEKAVAHEPACLRLVNPEASFYQDLFIQVFNIDLADQLSFPPETPVTIARLLAYILLEQGRSADFFNWCWNPLLAKDEASACVLVERHFWFLKHIPIQYRTELVAEAAVKSHFPQIQQPWTPAGYSWVQQDNNLAYFYQYSQYLTAQAAQPHILSNPEIVAEGEGMCAEGSWPIELVQLALNPGPQKAQLKPELRLKLYQKLLHAASQPNANLKTLKLYATNGTYDEELFSCLLEHPKYLSPHLHPKLATCIIEQIRHQAARYSVGKLIQGLDPNSKDFEAKVILLFPEIIATTTKRQDRRELIRALNAHDRHAELLACLHIYWSRPTWGSSVGRITQHEFFDAYLQQHKASLTVMTVLLMKYPTLDNRVDHSIRDRISYKLDMWYDFLIKTEY